MILFIGGLIYFPFSIILNQAYFKIFLLGLTIQSLGTYSYIIACKEIGTASAPVIAYCFYIWILVYEFLFLKRKMFLGLGVGICFLLIGSIGLLKFNTHTLNLKGLTSLLICTIAWAIVFIVLEKNRLNYYLTTLYLIVGVACGFPIICVSQGVPLINKGMILTNIYFFVGFSLLATLLPFLINIYVLPLIGAYKLAVFSNLEQVLVLTVTGFLLQEPLLPTQMIAGLMIILGVFLAIYFDKTKKLQA